jgi:hypothetical protein
MLPAIRFTAWTERKKITIQETRIDHASLLPSPAAQEIELEFFL